VTKRIRAIAGPLLIVGCVLVVLHGFAFGGKLSDQHPDVLAFWLPTYCFLGKGLAAGHIAAWNPYVMAGVPFAADPQSGWMYLPAMALFGVLPCDLAIRWMIVLQPVLAGLGIYWFMRNEGLSRAAATTAGLSLSLGLSASRLVLFLPFPSSFAWTALLLAACSKYLRATTWSGRLAWCAVTAAAWGQLAGAYAGHGLLIGTGAMVAYVAAKVFANLRSRVWRRREVVRLLALLLPALALINLAVLLPRLLYLGRSSYGSGFANFAQGVGLDAAWPIRFAAVPGAYLGAAALALAFAGWRSQRHRGLVVAFSAFGALSYVLGLRVVAPTLSSVTRHVPLLDFYRHYPGRFSLGLWIAVPILAGLGLETWLDALSARDRIAMIVPGLLVWLVLPAILGVKGSELALLGLGGAAAAIALGLTIKKPAFVLFVPLFMALELTTNGLVGQGGRTSPPSNLVAEADSTGWFGPLLAPKIEGSAYLADGPIVRAVRASDDGRFLSLDTRLATNRGYLTNQDRKFWGLLANQRSMLFGVEDIQGYNPFQLSRYWTYVRTVATSRLDYNAAFFLDPTSTTLNLFQVAWIVGPVEEPPMPDLVPAAEEGDWGLFALPSIAPRAQVIASWNVVKGSVDALAEVTRPGFDASNELVLEPNSGLALLGGIQPPVEGLGQTVTYRAEGTQAARLEVQTDRPAVVLVRNVYDRGWKATVDGRSTSLLPADYLMQGIPVPAGTHTIVLSYDDPSIGYGLLGSVVSLVGMLGFALVLRRRRLAREARARNLNSGG
jgi:hypothetical protein